MRPFEIIFVAITAGAAICLGIDRWRRIGRFLVAVSLIAAIVHAVFEGAHWQMIPAYAAMGILCIVAWRQERLRPRLQTITALSAISLTAMAVLVSWLLPLFHLPKPTGSYPIGTTILYFKDTARIDDASPVAGSPRELMVQLWYPARPSRNRFARYREPRETRFSSSYQSMILTNSRLDAPVASAGGPFPVILFNHGLGGRRTNDTFLTEELASYGYIVASIDHTYNASQVAFPDGRVVLGNAPGDISSPDSSSADRVMAIWNKELLKWVADQRFILDRLEAMNLAAGTPWFGRLNTNMTGAIGHSFGGAAATQACAEDPRIHAAVNMDGWFFAAIHARGSNQALLVMNAFDSNAIPDPNAKVDALLDKADEADMEASLSRFGGYRLQVAGAAHDDFTDQPLVSPLRKLSHSGKVPAPRMQDIVRTYVLAFFDSTLRGQDPGILNAESSPYAEATLRIWPGRKDAATVSSLSAGR